MSEYEILWTSSFKKDYKKVIKQGLDINKLDDVICMLAEGKKLPAHMKDHNLKGIWSGFRECHISPDWLLIYKQNEKELILTLTRTGSHSNLLNL